MPCLLEIGVKVVFVELYQFIIYFAFECQDFVLVADQAWQEFLLFVKTIFPEGLA